MNLPRELRTNRLLLRRWRQSDRPEFAAINADPRVMEYFPAVLTRAESDALVDRIERHFDEHGFGLWAVEIPGVVACAGFVGLAVPQFRAHFTPCVEAGWRLAAGHWGKGYATEAAMAALAFGFDDVGLSEIVSFTVAENLRSRGVMERIGMIHDPAEDFDHPAFATGTSAPLRRGKPDLRRHVLYRISSARLSPDVSGMRCWHAG
jgi:ribosomal-protein-alanine N-acetyltransferase